MQSATMPPNESARLRALHDLDILDTRAEVAYDDLTRLAAFVCKTPIALVGFVDADRQWFKSSHGLALQQTARTGAFCAHTVLGRTVFEVEDAGQDGRFADNPLVTGASGIVFYAGVPLEVEPGVNVGTLCVMDTKPRRLLDEERSALRCVADQVVANLRLRSTHEALQRAQQAKEAFIACMSHEVRTPMNGIIGLTTLLFESTDDPDTREQLATIQNCSSILLTILNDLLDYSRVEAKKVVFEALPFNLEAVLRNIQELSLPLARDKGLTVRVDNGGPPHWFVGDSMRLSQALTILVGNALKFSDAGEIEVTVQKRATREGVVGLTFSVRDDGIGIPAEAHGKLFKSFSQVDASATRKYAGSGLGLAICKGLVDGMGGRIWVESAPGQGSTFRFCLECPVAEAPAPPHLIGEEPDGKLSVTRPLSILVAEDHRINQIVALKLLANLGYEADLAASGVEALRMLESKRYDLVLMDCQMPEMDGYEATQRIFDNYAPGDRPVVYALTAAVTDEEMARCRAVGMHLVIQKPVSLATLRSALLEYPSRRAAAPPALHR